MASQDKYNDDSVPEPEAVDTDNMEDLFPKVENPPTKTLFQKDHLSEDKIKVYPKPFELFILDFICQCK